MPKDYYEILGVPRNADKKQIRSAFRKLARKYHPDVNPNNAEATEKFKEINEAHEVLSDPDKRAKYDQYGARWKEYDAWEKAGRPGRSPFAEAEGPQPHVEYRTVDIENYEDLFGTADPFSDFFHDMFGDSVRARGRQSARSARPASRRGEDVEAETTITLEEAYSGTTRTVQLEGPDGTRRVEVRIPPGIRDGARV